MASQGQYKAKTTDRFFNGPIDQPEAARAFLKMQIAVPEKRDEARRQLEARFVEVEARMEELLSGADG